MGLDIRVPLGLIFLIVGGIMSLFGIFTRGSALYDKSMGVNLNMGWGTVHVCLRDDHVHRRPPTEVAG